MLFICPSLIYRFQAVSAPFFQSPLNFALTYIQFWGCFSSTFKPFEQKVHKLFTINHSHQLSSYRKPSLRETFLSLTILLVEKKENERFIQNKKSSPSESRKGLLVTIYLVFSSFSPHSAKSTAKSEMGEMPCN